LKGCNFEECTYSADDFTDQSSFWYGGNLAKKPVVYWEIRQELLAQGSSVPCSFGY
jgi:hypothetical protein